MITITTSFSEEVFVDTTGGTPSIALETGSSDRLAIYSSGSGTSTLSFDYRIEAGDSSADLDQLSSSAFSLNGGSIKDAVGNDAVLSLPEPGAVGSLGANADLVIDGSAPTIDTTAPTIAITAADVSSGDTSNDAFLSLTFTLSEASSSFAVGDISASGGSISDFAGSGESYSARFTPATDGVTAINVNAGAFTDAAGNNNTAASSFSWNYDGSAPSVSALGPSTADLLEPSAKD